MARGGMYDQLAGGFARYSVDADWVVPHFEKMLYDNALLARVYAHLWRRTGSPLARRVAEGTCDWLIAELATAEGGFASALDADSDGSEGAFYVWTPGQLTAVLGPDGWRVCGRRLRRDGGRHLRAWRLGAPATGRPGGRRPARPGSAAACSRRGRSERVRAGTTRSSPPGTAWPSRLWPTPARCSPGRTSSPLPPRRRSCWPPCTSRTGGWPAPPGMAARRPRRACSTTTAVWRPA